MNITEKVKEINSDIKERVGELWEENPSHIVVPVVIVLCTILGFILGRLSTKASYSTNTKKGAITGQNELNSSILLPPDAYSEPLSTTPNTTLRAGSLASAIASTNRGSVLADPNTASPNSIPKDIQIVASTRGKTYYFSWCAGAKNILESNKRYFTNVEQAKSAGLKPSKTCKGLY